MGYTGLVTVGEMSVREVRIRLQCLPDCNCASVGSRRFQMGNRAVIQT